MNRERLAAALLAAGLPPESFQIPGVHDADPPPTDFWFLRAGDGGWQVGAFERGVHDVRERFSDEAAAAAWMYRTLTGRPPP